MAQPDLLEKLIALCKRRGFIFQSSEIYGGLNGFWDYGPLGVELKRNIKQAWWHDLVTSRDDIVGLDSSIIMNPRIWEASGHVTGFSDPMVDCTACKKRYRADQVWLRVAVLRQPDAQAARMQVLASYEADGPGQIPAAKARSAEQTWRRLRAEAPRDESVQLGDTPLVGPGGRLSDGQPLSWPEQLRAPCPDCGAALTPARRFNLMFKTYVGALEESSALAYLRPETAQGIFANFRNVLDTTRIKLPFGIAQIGKAFRNEINPRNYTFRSREFEQMEIEFFCHPSQADQWYEYWRDARYQWYVQLGLRSERLRLRDHEPHELAHYARACADVEYDFPFGTSELEGVANRTDFDLTQHQRASGKDMTYFDDATRQRFIPYVIEPSAGVDRTALALLCEAYTEDQAPDEKGVPQPRTLLRLHPRVAPIKAAFLPLVKRDGMPEIARSIYQAVRPALPCFYDEKGAIGRRYRRQDEAGTPFCFTVDGQTLQDGTVTVRDRDTLRQERIDRSKVMDYLRDRLGEYS
ncbi:MAG: glycine--tRNA ligase [Phycisphaerae bacterium]